MDAITKTAQLQLTRHAPEYWRVTINNPPLNVMGRPMVQEFERLIEEIESDPVLKVVVFDSTVEGFFLNHSDFTAPLESLTSLPPGGAVFPRGRTSLFVCLAPRSFRSRSSEAAQPAMEANSYWLAT
ncbi:Clp protease/crotonase-like domain-containing protein [Sphingomonas daechungensis]|uniref:hypothetical protein n=1 Tax=Sphingomonas daechungensis TaxID=1176646 RepID=UPI001CB8DC35|nr:hypothetical protein [Sphingomonas daechungensis]